MDTNREMPIRDLGRTGQKVSCIGPTENCQLLSEISRNEARCDAFPIVAPWSEQLSSLIAGGNWLHACAQPVGNGATKFSMMPQNVLLFCVHGRLPAICCACLRVREEVLPLLGGANFTPARRAFDSPMAI